MISSQYKIILIVGNKHIKSERSVIETSNAAPLQISRHALSIAENYDDHIVPVTVKYPEL